MLHPIYSEANKYLAGIISASCLTYKEDIVQDNDHK